jgi:hypothetical protein
MYLFKDQAKELMKSVTSDMSGELKEKTDYILALLNDDDWSMIIKAHALIESLVTELLLAKTEEPKLRSLIERLPLSDEQLGKVKIAKDYGLLSSHERTFIKKLSSLRNDLVHKFENINFNLPDYVDMLDKNQKKAWKSTFTWYQQEKEVSNNWAEATIENPKTAVWLSIFMFVAQNVIKIGEIKGNIEITQAANQTAEKLLNEIV